MASQPSAVRTMTHTTTRASGSATVVETEARQHETVSLSSGTLRLRAEPVETQHVQWAEDVVDNEGMGKKSSKVCCIYHKPRAVGESSDEDSSSSSSDSDSSDGGDDGAAHPTNRRGRECDGHDHGHDHHHGTDKKAKSTQKRGTKRTQRGDARKPSPNAYEKMPKYSTNSDRAN